MGRTGTRTGGDEADRGAHIRPRAQSPPRPDIQRRSTERAHIHITQHSGESARCLNSCIVESEAQRVSANAPGRCEQIGREGLELSELFLNPTQQRLIDPSLVALETHSGDTLLKMLGEDLLLAICTGARIRRAHT